MAATLLRGASALLLLLAFCGARAAAQQCPVDPKATALNFEGVGAACGEPCAGRGREWGRVAQGGGTR